MEEQEIYQKAIDKWGYNLQLTMMIEEMAELQQVICKIQRKCGVNPMFQEFVEEIVDVQIMLEQMKIIGRLAVSAFDSEYESQFDKKLMRLEKRVTE